MHCKKRNAGPSFENFSFEKRGMPPLSEMKHSSFVVAVLGKDLINFFSLGEGIVEEDGEIKRVRSRKNPKLIVMFMK